MEPQQQFLERPVRLVEALRAGSERTAQGRGDPGLVGEAFNTDNLPVHVMLALLLPIRFAVHESDVTQPDGGGFAFALKSGKASTA